MLTEAEEAVGHDVQAFYVTVRALIQALDHPQTRRVVEGHRRLLLGEARQLIHALDDRDAPRVRLASLPREARA